MKRRHFIKNISAASAGAVMLGGYPVRLLAGNSKLKSLAATGNNDNVLVLVQLHGGNDALNTLIPLDQYNLYYNYRPNIAISDSGPRRYIPVDNSLPAADQVGLHPDMIGFKELYDAGKATIVQNVGYENMNLSHFRGRDIMFMGGDSGDYFHSGWMGRFLDVEYPGYPDAYPDANMPDPIGIELGGAMSLAFHRENGIPIGLNIYNPDEFYQLISNVGVDLPIAFPDSHAGDELRYLMEFELMSNKYAGRLKNVYDSGTNTSGVIYPETYPRIAPDGFLRNPLSGQLRLIARLLSGGIKTRIFLCRIGGFDTHGQQVEQYDSSLGAHAALLYHLSSAIKAFHDDLDAQGLEEKVITMTFTEFGRRVYSNASYGTDHGTATPVFLFGSSLAGGVIGHNPDLDNLNGGNLRFSIDYRQVYAAVVQDWFGASDEAVQAAKFDSWVDKKVDLFGVTGLSDYKSENPLRFEINPNPATEYFTVRFYVADPENVRLTMLDSSGKTICTLIDEKKAFGYSQDSFNVNGLAKGNYILMIKAGNCTVSKKLIIY